MILRQLIQTNTTRHSQGGNSALRFFMFCILLLLAFSVHGKNIDTLCIVEWNIENLFDCRHDTLKNDQEFLPESLRHWTYHRYRRKLDNVAKCITAIGGWAPPALVALCEVENDSVLITLTRFSALAEMDYQYVMTHSRDQRGIDVALLYQRDQFRLISCNSIEIPFEKKYRPTRDILHVTGQVISGDTLDIFIVHAPSRAGGALETEPYRILCAETLKRNVDETAKQRFHPYIIITGDFNDYPENFSIAKVLKALPPNDFVDNTKLYHLLSRQIKRTNGGTYKFKGEWGLLDHFIVSGSLLNKLSSIYTDESLTEIINYPFLLTDDKTYGGNRPFRTYYGMRYEGGFSDHLPIRMKVIVK